jgi:hypothetical protein
VRNALRDSVGIRRDVRTGSSSESSLAALSIS